MTKNKLSDLNDHLFAQLERLSDEHLDAKKIAQEVKRAEAVVAVSDKIIGTADLRLKAAKLYAEHGDKITPHLPMIGNGGGS